METAADMIRRNITLVLWPSAQSYKQEFAASYDLNYQEISRRLVIAKDWDEYWEMMDKVTSTGMYAEIGYLPGTYMEEWIYWYRGSEPIVGDYPYLTHLTNKKWPLKKVFIIKMHKKDK